MLYGSEAVTIFIIISTVGD